MNKLEDTALSELVKAAVIDSQTADKIHNYYKGKSSLHGKTMGIVLASIGLAMMGLALILFVAHNWDNLSRTQKIILAYIPLVLGQIYSFFVLGKNGNSKWRELSSCILFFAVGVVLALVAQIYHIHGNVLFTWMVLVLPIVYLMRSSLCAFLYLIGITGYNLEEFGGIFNVNMDPLSRSYHYWWMVILIIPHFYSLLKTRGAIHILYWAFWLLPLSILISLSCIGKNTESLLWVAFFSLFSIFSFVGKNFLPNEFSGYRNGFNSIPIIGVQILWLVMGFQNYWVNLSQKSMHFGDILGEPEFAFSLLLMLLALLFFLIDLFKRRLTSSPVSVSFLVFFALYVIGQDYFEFSWIISNLFILFSGVYYILRGFHLHHFGILNLGMVIITSLAASRFFDHDISFLIRGLLFFIAGAGFLLSNFYLMKRSKPVQIQQHE